MQVYTILNTHAGLVYYVDMKNKRIKTLKRVFMKKLKPLKTIFV